MSYLGLVYSEMAPQASVMTSTEMNLKNPMKIAPRFMMLLLPSTSSLFAWEKDREKFCPSMAFFWFFDRLNSLLKILG